ncbi:unnamed protein product, partial [Polarella glacialis]
SVPRCRLSMASQLQAIPGLDDSLPQPAFGGQADSAKPSHPTWSLPRSTRDDAKKVHISPKHQQDIWGRDSPGPGAYSPQRQRRSPGWSFGTGKRPTTADSRRRPPDSCADLTAKIPSPPKEVTRPRPRSASMGTASRNAIVVQPDMPSYPADPASPGPQRYRPPSSAPASPSYTIRSRGSGLLDTASSTSPKVGPGSYTNTPLEYRSSRRAGPRWSLNKQDRWRQPKLSANETSGRLWDGAGTVRLKLQRNLSAPPNYSFSSCSRDGRSRQGFLQTAADKGPAGELPALSLECPDLPPRLGPNGAPHINPV